MAEILNLEINLDQALKDATALKTQVGLLRAQLKSLKGAGKENSAEFIELSAQMKFTTNQLRSQESMIQKNIVAEKTQTGSLDQLKAQLSIVTAKWNQLSGEERLNLESGKALTAEKARLTEALKAEETATGDARRNVGNYEGAVVSVRTEMRNLTDALIAAKMSGDENSETVKNMKNRLAQLKDSMIDVNNETNILASDTKNFDLAAGSLSAFGSAAQVAQGSMALLGGENEDMQETLQKMMVTQTLLNNLQAVGNSLQKESAFIIALNTVKTKIAIAAQWLWNVAVTANPIGLLVVGVGALVAAVSVLAIKMSAGSKETDKLNAKLKALELQSKSAADFDEYYIRVLEAKGLKDTDITDQMIRNNIERRNALQKELDIFTTLRLKQGVLDKEQSENESKKYEELNKLSDDYNILQIKREKQLKAESDKRIEEQEAAEKEYAEIQIQNATLIFEQNKIKRDNSLKNTSLNYDKLIALENSLYNQGAAIEKKRYTAGLISREEYNNALFKIDNERDSNIESLNKKRAEEAVANMNLEVLKFQESYNKKNSILDEHLVFNKDIEEKKLNDSIAYEEQLSSKQQEILKSQLDNKLITQSDYDTQFYQSQVDLETKISELRKAYQQSEIERVQQVALTNSQNELSIYENNLFAKFELQKVANEKARNEEIRQANKIGADISKIEAKYAKIDIALEKAKNNAKLELVSGFAGNLATIFSESTEIGKAAAVAETTINTYASATAAYKGMVSAIPGPAGVAAGIAAAAEAVEMGRANVKKILSISTDSSSTSSASVSESSASDVANTTTSLSSVNTSIGQGIVSRTSDSGISETSQAVTTVLVIDDVIEAQTKEYNKVVASTI